MAEERKWRRLSEAERGTLKRAFANVDDGSIGSDLLSLIQQVEELEQELSERTRNEPPRRRAQLACPTYGCSKALGHAGSCDESIWKKLSRESDKQFVGRATEDTRDIGDGLHAGTVQLNNPVPVLDAISAGRMAKGQAGLCAPGPKSPIIQAISCDNCARLHQLNATSYVTVGAIFHGEDQESIIERVLRLCVSNIPGSDVSCFEVVMDRQLSKYRSRRGANR